MIIRENPDKEKVKEVREALKKNDGYCPCKLIKTESTKCMCDEFKNQLYGLCHCELYEKI